LQAPKHDKKEKQSFLRENHAAKVTYMDSMR
jgi:hypothetical protein